MSPPSAPSSLLSPSDPLRGLWVPIVTPFHGDGALDLESLQRLAQRLLDDGAHGLVALGTTGESATLTADERRQVVVACDAVCADAGRGLMVGAGTNSTQSTIADVADLTAATSARAALVVTPYYTRPSPAGVVGHFRAVADASTVPIVVYNVPYRSGVDLGAAELLELSGHDGIVGVKQAVGAVDADTMALLGGASPDFAVLCGDDPFIAPIGLLGGAGAIAASAHLATERFVALVDASLVGDAQLASPLAASLLPLVRTGFAEPNPAVFKAVLAHAGEIATPTLRSPMTAASDAAVRAAVQAVETVKAGRSR